MNRISYKNTHNEHELKSTSSFSHPTNGGRFHIILDTKEMGFKIIDEMANGMVAKEGWVRPTKSALHKLKIKAKNALLEMGIDGFETEKRNVNRMTEADLEAIARGDMA